ncbi:MAG: hypothetical protein QCI38_02910, partial [Candidatus Thermoplasmatota archaeon]|nr:hypothetical protein [Candidatus Thermoplasmatota archaeon]
MLKREDEKKDKKNWGAIIAILLFISVLVPVAIFTLSVEDTGDSTYTGTYAEILQKHEELGLKSGDTVIIEDVLSGIWYNASTGYTYLQFQSGDELRASPTDYEAGYPNHNALDMFRAGD